MTIAENPITTAATSVDSEIDLFFDLTAIAGLTRAYVVPGNPEGYITIKPDSNSIIETFKNTIIIKPTGQAPGTYFFNSLTFDFKVKAGDLNEIVSIENVPTQSNVYNKQGQRSATTNYTKHIDNKKKSIKYSRKSGVCSATLGKEELTFTIDVQGPSYPSGKTFVVIWDPIAEDEGKV